jgi:hypothetical protein
MPRLGVRIIARLKFWAKRTIHSLANMDSFAPNLALDRIVKLCYDYL